MFLFPDSGRSCPDSEFWNEVLRRAREPASRVAPGSGYDCLLAVAAAAIAGVDLLLLHDEQVATSLAAKTADATERPAPLPTDLPPEGSAPPAVLLRRIEASPSRVGILTSGSTGQPKCVWHSLPALLRDVRRGDHHRDDVWGFAYHPAHFAGLQVLLQALTHQNRLVELFRLPPPAIHRAIETHGVTHLSATPTFFRRFLGCPGTHPGVRRVTTGGERSTPELRRELARAFPNAKVLNIYASTEAGTLLVAEGEHFRVPERYADRIRVDDGQLMVHRSLLGQVDDDSSLPIGPDGFFATGDLVDVVSPDPLTVRFVSRANEIINVGGYKVAPHDVEAQLLAMAEVAEAAVYGKANSVTGYLVAADVVLRPGATLDAGELRRRLAGSLPRHEQPRLVRFVDRVGQTATGKKSRGGSEA